MDDSQARLERIDDYIASLFGSDDPALARNLADAEAAGLPPINVSANQGRLIYLLAKMSRAERILEIGTLGGYSTTWLARALPPGGLVVSLEVSDRHAAVARHSIARAVPGVNVAVRAGPALSLVALPLGCVSVVDCERYACRAALWICVPRGSKVETNEWPEYDRPALWSFTRTTGSCDASLGGSRHFGDTSP